MYNQALGVEGQQIDVGPVQRKLSIEESGLANGLNAQPFYPKNF
jgi:hypothetical protein